MNFSFLDSRFLVQFALSIIYFVIFFMMLKVKDGRTRILLLRERLGLAFLLFIGSIRGIMQLCGNPYDVYGNTMMYIISVILLVIGIDFIIYLKKGKTDKENK